MIKSIYFFLNDSNIEGHQFIVSNRNLHIIVRLINILNITIPQEYMQFCFFQLMLTASKHLRKISCFLFISIKLFAMYIPSITCSKICKHNKILISPLLVASCLSFATYT